MKNIRIPLFISALLILICQQAFAEDVSIETILSAPDNYNGKKVSVLGIPYASYDGAYIHDNEGNDLHLGILSRDTDIESIHEAYGSMCLIKGIFYKAEYLTPGLYLPDRISSVSFVMPLYEKEYRNRLGYALQAIMDIDGQKTALLVDFRSGKGYKVKTGESIRGLFSKKITAILKDRILVEEECPQCTDDKIRRFEVLLKSNQR